MESYLRNVCGICSQGSLDVFCQRGSIFTTDLSGLSVADNVQLIAYIASFSLYEGFLTRVVVENFVGAGNLADFRGDGAVCT